MEIIHVAGYSLEDKLPIAKRFEQTTFPFTKILPLGTFFHGKESNTGWLRRTLMWRRRCSRRLCKATHKRLESGRIFVYLKFAMVKYFSLPFMLLASIYQCVT